jgi:ribosomal protein S18 acetylase RimI-like enzyme
MFSVNYQVETEVSREDLLGLYEDANWTAYTQDPDKLCRAVKQSLRVITARIDGQLIGLIRAVGDGLTILYIQDILVHTTYKRKGVGRKLVELLFADFPDVRQKVLLTDDNPETRGFYESIGFQSCDDGRLVAFVKLSNQA